MDINLHSFILVVGVIVIIFIVVDGIKKVREAPSNQFDDDILDNDLLDSDSEFVARPESKQEQNFNELEIADELVTEAFVGELPDDGSNIPEADAENRAEQFEKNLTQEMAEDDFSANDEPEFEHFSAIEDKNTDSTDSVEAPEHPRKRHANQPSKSEVEDKRRALAKSQAPVENILEPLLDVPESVPVLMEPVHLGGEVDPNPPVQHEIALPEFVQQSLKQPAVITAALAEPDFDSFSIDDLDNFPLEQEPVEVVQAPSTTENTSPVGEKLSARPVAQEVFVINVLKETGPLLKGAELHHIFKACDMRHGEMGIFHRFEEPNAQGKIQFSVVNALKPGSFDLTTIDVMETKGISLFMSLPGPDDAMGAFDAMAEVALVFARNFGASMYDESHSDLTPQTLEHYRNRVREYSRKQFSKK
ncbi:MAG: cell division protein ZipA [Psychrobacter glaciei]|jgi:cell division protein ZipA